ncbi:MAG: UMP kinase [Gammaproteobacteria bacterium]|nr:UMP kinase [Gammaproteobacteria bacterium]
MARDRRRVLLKLSGEALMGDNAYGIDPKTLDYYCEQLIEVMSSGCQVAVVIGGGNIFRGVSLAASGMNRVSADHMGMLATVINGLALQDNLERRGIAVRLQSGLRIGHAIEPFSHKHALHHLEHNRLVIFVAGTGSPFFSTDTAASLRAAEIEADLLVKATKVDGVYSADPLSNPNATRYDVLSFSAILEQQLGVMDAAAIALCRENDIPLRVCDVQSPGNLLAVVNGEHVGTLVNREGKL